MANVLLYIGIAGFLYVEKKIVVTSTDSVFFASSLNNYP